jgi:hypothetical protein
MKNLVIILLLLLIGMVIIMPFAATAAPDPSSDGTINLTVTPTRVVEPPVKVIITPVQTPRPGSGEVQFPVIRDVTPTPTILRTTTPIAPATTIPATTIIPRTTISATRTTPPTIIPVTQTTTVPVVTVTVFVYQSSPVYQPVYYYPPYYPYAINSYYPTGSLTVTSNPSGATVIIDGYNAEITPWIFTGLTTGYHTVEVDYSGYEAYVTSVYVDYGANTEINADLTSLVAYGSMVVESTPEGADVYVDGNYQGISPVTIGGLSAGYHQVELHLAGYEVLTSTEKVVAGQGTVTTLILTPHSTLSDTGSIDITSNMPGALVYLDGIYKGSTYSGSPFNVISVSPGSHTLLLHVPGYTDFTKTIEVNAGQISNINAEFTASATPTQNPVSPSSATGSIIITSTPAGGQVTVDDKFRGVAPVTIYNLGTGSHIINMKLPGYSDWSTSVDVSANQMVQVSAKLTPGSGAVPVTPSIGLSPFAIIGALAIGAIVLSSRKRK